MLSSTLPGVQRMSKICIAILFAAGLSCSVESARPQTPPVAKPDSPSPKTASAQASSAFPEDQGQREPFPELPILKIKLNDPVVTGGPDLHVYMSPTFCSPDGTPYVIVLDSTDFRKRTICSLDARGAHAFTTGAIPDLYDINFSSDFVGDSTVGLLVNATRDNKTSARKGTMNPGSPPRDVYIGEHHDFLLEFDRSANFKRTVDLPNIYHFWRVAELADGALLPLAYDRANAVPRLVVLDSDGQIIRSLEVPQQMSDTPELRQGQSGEPMKQAMAESSISWWLFASARQKILLYQARSHSPVLEVGAGGAVREVPLQAPKGYALESIISSSDRWLICYRRDGLPDGQQIDARPEAKNFILYEVNPSDGSLKSQIDLVTDRRFEIACEQDSSLIGFAMESDKLLRISADLPR